MLPHGASSVWLIFWCSSQVLIRGPIVSKGYYKNDEQTKETFDAEGWLHTGDIGK